MARSPGTYRTHPTQRRELSQGKPAGLQQGLPAIWSVTHIGKERLTVPDSVFPGSSRSVMKGRPSQGRAPHPFATILSLRPWGGRAGGAGRGRRAGRRLRAWNPHPEPAPYRALSGGHCNSSFEDPRKGGVLIPFPGLRSAPEVSCPGQRPDSTSTHGLEKCEDGLHP